MPFDEQEGRKTALTSIAVPFEKRDVRSHAGDSTLMHELALDALPRLFVVPAFNEEANLPRLLDDLEQRAHLFTEGSCVLIVDDGSSDGTADVVRRYSGPVPVELIELGVNQGPGAAFRAGFAAALERCPDEGYIVTLEADTTSDLDALPVMLGHAAAGAELVLASVHGGGQMVNVS